MATALFFQAGNVRKRNEIFYFRMRVPKILKPVFSEHEFTVTLKTTDALQARTAIASYRAEIKRITLALSIRAITPALAKRLVESVLYARPYQPADELPPLLHGDAEIPPAKAAKLLRHVMEEYVALRESNWGEKTKTDYKTLIKHIDAKFGRTPVDELTPERLTIWRNTLEEQSIQHANKHITFLSAVLKMAVRRRYCNMNSAEGLLITDTRQQTEIRVGYTDAEINLIYRLIIKTQDPYGTHPERFWVPLISMFSGMRLDEICQLYVSDIKVEFDELADKQRIFYFDINKDADKKVKTADSPRFVPFHSVLLKWGLDEFVYIQQQAGHKRLFPGLKKTKVGYSNAVQKWYSRWNKVNITKDKKKTFHSLRHSFSDRLKQLRTEPTLTNEILGHKVYDISASRYASEYSLRTKLDAICNVVYETEQIVFSHIMAKPRLVKSTEI